jgi:type I restriction enzyme M protein
VSAFAFARPAPAVMSGVFVACSHYIYKHDNVSPAAAFAELVKIVFLKMHADRELHRTLGTRALTGAVPAASVVFSAAWIEAHEAQHLHPLDLQFQALCARLEADVQCGRRKRIFDPGDTIHLQPDTAKALVAMLQHYDLYSVDEDLNGRLFEAFLSATMRGRELGQYFTPRSVVKLMTGLAELQVDATRVDRVLDPCCGSGGFLIEAAAALGQAIDGGAFSPAQKQRLRRTLREDSLFGIDIGRVPPIARIARINLHLHGDAGSRVYVAEALDKDAAARDEEGAELRALAADASFDVILTNPPFAKEYDHKIQTDRALMAPYALATDGKQRLRSSELFVERYRDLLRPGGKVLAVLDDSLLGSKRFSRVRAFLREHFIVRAVISLPGDAFRRAGARVKTSIVYLTRRVSPDEAQPDVFMWYCTAVGIEDSARQRVSDGDRRQEAHAEVATVLAAFRATRAGDGAQLVPAAQMADRLDVKSCLLHPGRKVQAWQRRGLAVATLGSFVTARAEKLTAAPDQRVRLLSVRYDGHAAETSWLRATIKYSDLHVVRAGDLVVSHINAIHGGVCVLPAAMDGAAASPEYTVLTARPGVSADVLWAILRSPELRAELLARASGLGRHRIAANVLLRLPIPTPTAPVAAASEAAFRRALALDAEATAIRQRAQAELEQALDLRSDAAERILLAFKPPR